VEFKSLGDQLVESDAFKDMVAKNRRTSEGVQVKTFTPHLAQKMPMLETELKTLTTGASSGGAAIDPRRLAELIAYPITDALRLRSIMPVTPVSTGSIEFVRETAFHQLMTQFSAQEAVGQTVLSVDSAVGFYDGQTITLGYGEGDSEDRVIATSGIDLTEGANTITVTVATGAQREVDELIVSDTFIFTPETYLKPLAEATFELVTKSVKTLAHALPSSRQILADAPRLRAHVDRRLLEGLVLSEERQFLYGDGSTNQIDGILADADINSYSWSSGTSGDTKLDALRRAMTLSSLAHFPVDYIVVNPQDREDLELVKGSDGHYIWAQVPSGAGARIWRAQVVETTAIDAATALVGSFRLGVEVFDREMSEIRVSEHHADYFLRNMVAILAEERLCQAVLRPPSFTAVTFDSAPA
jgi:hypothetical protein